MRGNLLLIAGNGPAIGRKEGYIYPKESRGIRELLRIRLIFVQQQTSFLLGIQSMITRYENVCLSVTKLGMT